MKIIPGNPTVRGCIKIKDSYNFSVISDAEKLNLLIFESPESDPLYCIELDENFRTGNVYSVLIGKINLDRFFYCYEKNGEMFPDPCSKTITGCEKFSQIKEEGNKKNLSLICLSKYNWKNDTYLNIPYSDSIFYKCSVRGFTKSESSHVRNKGTFKGMTEKLPYLKKLGITAVILMPAYEYDECGRFFNSIEERIDLKSSIPVSDVRHNSFGVSCFDNKKVNYWGYTKGFYFAPKSSFCACVNQKTDYTTEFKNMVKEYHKNGIEIIMEFHFMDETPDFIMDCLRFWHLEYHIDGFHIFCDWISQQAVIKDPLLAKTKIIVTNKDDSVKSYGNVAVYNSWFMDTARKFLKGDENQLGEFVNVCRNNPGNGGCINYITSHDGFTLFDLVSYDRKHNELNGENNTDGENFNNSWNCGEEGITKRKKVINLRIRQIKNAFIMLMMSQAAPLIVAGDEFLNSQEGNNNPYCIDSEISWINWKNRGNAAKLTKFVSELISFRKAHKILHMDNKLLAYDSLSCGFPDVSVHGSSAWYNAVESYNRHIGIMYCGKYADEDKLIYTAYNTHWISHELALPIIDKDSSWEVIISSGTQKDVSIDEKDRIIKIGPRCSAILMADMKSSL